MTLFWHGTFPKFMPSRQDLRKANLIYACVQRTPFYYILAQDSRYKPGGRHLENLGSWDPIPGAHTLPSFSCTCDLTENSARGSGTYPRDPGGLRVSSFAMRQVTPGQRAV